MATSMLWHKRLSVLALVAVLRLVVVRVRVEGTLIVCAIGHRLVRPRIMQPHYLTVRYQLTHDCSPHRQSSAPGRLGLALRLP